MRKFSYPALILLLVSFSFSMSPVPMRAEAEQHLLYVASPGVRNYVEYGGVGVLVFDVDKGYKFVRRIQTWTVPDGSKPENVKGIAASATTGRIYVTSLNRMIAIDAVSGKKIWTKPTTADAIGWRFHLTARPCMSHNSREQHGTW